MISSAGLIIYAAMVTFHVTIDRIWRNMTSAAQEDDDQAGLIIVHTICQWFGRVGVWLPTGKQLRHLSKTMFWMSHLVCSPSHYLITI